MPLLKIQKKASYRFAIWEITEPESFFQKSIPLVSDSKWEKRRLEFLCSRHLLKLLNPSFPFEKVQLSATGKPLFPSGKVNFSISHSFPFVGAAIAESPIGIDVQIYQKKIIELQQKFLSTQEQSFFNNDLRQITLAWAAKESVFKWSNLSGIDFKQHMPISDFSLNHSNARMIIHFKKVSPIICLNLKGKVETDFGWMITIPQ